MIVRRASKFRLYPTPVEAERFTEYAGAARFVFNLGLEQRRDWWRQKMASTGSGITFFTQSNELTALRAECEWIGAMPRVIQVQAVRDLDAAFKAFFGGQAEYPRFRCRGADESFRLEGRRVPIRKVSGRYGSAYVQGIGWVKFRQTRAIKGHVESVTITREQNGWHIVFQSRVEIADPIQLDNAVGIDRGITATIALSTGKLYASPATLVTLDRKARKAAKAMARKRKGSARREKAKQKLAKIKAKAARIRAHWAHERTTEIADGFGTVAIESLAVRNMMRSAKGTAEKPGRNVRAKAGLNRAIAERCWYQVERLLAYKLAERGGKLVKVNPAFTSQTCAACGTIDKASRESQARFVCRSCGHEDHADVNAARNILRLSRSEVNARGGDPLGLPSKRVVPAAA